MNSNQWLRWMVIFYNKLNWVLSFSYTCKLIHTAFCLVSWLFSPLAHEMESICYPCANHMVYLKAPMILVYGKVQRKSPSHQSPQRPPQGTFKCLNPQLALVIYGTCLDLKTAEFEISKFIKQSETHEKYLQNIAMQILHAHRATTYRWRVQEGSPIYCHGKATQEARRSWKAPWKI